MTSFLAPMAVELIPNTSCARRNLCWGCVNNGGRCVVRTISSSNKQTHRSQRERHNLFRAYARYVTIRSRAHARTHSAYSRLCHTARPRTGARTGRCRPWRRPARSSRRGSRARRRGRGARAAGARAPRWGCRRAWTVGCVCKWCGGGMGELGRRVNYVEQRARARSHAPGARRWRGRWRGRGRCRQRP